MVQKPCLPREKTTLSGLAQSFVGGYRYPQTTHQGSSTVLPVAIFSELAMGCWSNRRRRCGARVGSPGSDSHEYKGYGSWFSPWDYEQSFRELELDETYRTRCAAFFSTITQGFIVLMYLKGILLQKRLKNAVEECDFYRLELAAFSEGCRANVKIWEEDIRRWEEDQEKPVSQRNGVANPYEMPKAGMNLLVLASSDNTFGLQVCLRVRSVYF